MEPQQTHDPIQQPSPVTPQSTPVPIPAPQPSVATHPVANQIWPKAINATNDVTLLICVGFILFIDSPILMQDTSLITFYFMMLGALVIFVLCMVFEMWAGKRLKNIATSGLDTTIHSFVLVRNIIIILNTIPLIQLLGLLTAPLAFAFIIANAVMITMRLKQLPKPVISPTAT